MSELSSQQEKAKWWLSIRPVRDGVIVAGALFLVAVIGIFTTYQRGASAYADEVHSHLLDMARTAASQIDADQHAQITTSEFEGSDAHHHMIEPLYRLLETVPGVRYAYTMVLIDDQVYFVLDSPSPFEPNEDVAGVLELYDDADTEMLEALRTGREMVTKKFYSDGWGTFMSAYVPLRTSTGEHVGIVGIDMTANEYLARMSEMRKAMWISVAIAFVLSVLGGFLAGCMRLHVLNDRLRREEVIAQLRQREAELHKLSMVASRTDNGVIITDPEGRIEWINDGFTRITGYSFDEVVGKKPGQILHGPETDQSTVDFMRDAVQQGRGFAAEVINYSKSGRRFWMQVEVQPIRDESGEITHFMAIESDITERKRMEEALRHSEQHLRALIETTPACVKVVDADGTLLEMNATGLSFIQADEPSQAIGRCVFDLIAPEHRDAFIDFHQRVCAGERAQLEFEVIGLKSQRNWVLSYAAPLYDPDTGRNRHLAITHDITERKEADRELAQNRERFELMSCATQDVVWDYGVVQDHLWWNENLRMRFGYDPTTINPSFDWWASRVHHDDRAGTVQSINDALMGDDHHWYAEYRLQRADGTYALVLDRAYIIRDEAGNAVRVVGAIADLTEQKQSEEKIAFQKTLLECQAEASPDGILVVDNDQRVVSHNRRFMEMWQIPEDLLATGDDRQLLTAVIDQVADPEAFLARTEELMRHPEMNAADEIHLRDGRTFDRHTASIRTRDGVHYGRVWFFRDVTDKKQYEEKLEQHKLVVENSNAVLFRWRNAPGWPVELVSENVEQFGYSAEELLDGDVEFATMVHPDDFDRVAEEVQQYAAQNASTFEQEYRLVCRDGSVRWIYDRTVVERDDTGKASHFQGIVIDITERKHNEARMQRLLNDLEERVKENLTLIRALSCMHEGSDSVSETLQAIAEMLPDGFRAPDATAVRICVEDDEYRSRGFAQAEPMLVSSFRCEDGREGRVEVVLLESDQANAEDEVFLPEEEQLIRTIAQSLKSYLDRVRIEEKLRQHKVVVENSSTVLLRWRVAPNWPVEMVSENVSQFGYTAEDLLDGTVSFESIVHPDDRRHIEQEVLDCYENDIGSINQEYRIVCRDGSVRWVYDQTTAERDEHGRITHFQGIVMDVTERKEAEERLRDSEERLRRIASQVPGALYQFRLSTDGTRSFPYISDGVFDLCGVTREELEANPDAISAHVVSEDANELEASIEQSARTLEPWKLEFRIQHEDGSIRWIVGNSVPQRESDGSILWHGLIFDITDRKEAEEQLHRLRAIIEHTPDLVGIADANMQPIYINPAGRWMLGIGRNESFESTKVTDYSASWSTDILESVAIPAAIRNGVWIGVTAFLREDGSELPVSQVIISHKDADGNVRYISTVARDMTGNKRIEEALRQSQQFLRSTLDALSAHIAILDSEGRIIEVNEAWREFAVSNGLELRHFGIGANYFSTCEQSHGNCSEEATDAATGIQRILRGEIDRFDLEYPCHSADEKRWFALRATYFDTSNGRCVVVAHENITENKLATDELTRARDAAEAANRAKSEFLANMSHEIRTPMTAVLGYADLIMDTSLTEKERHGYLEVIHRNGNHLLGVINDILDISKIESGRMTVEQRTTSPVSVISEAISVSRAHAIEKNLSLDMEFATEIPESITTDPVRLRQILLNLIGNAIKFTNEGGVRVIMRYDDADEDGPQLTFQIIDTGIGLTHEQMTKLFQPFVQADSTMTRRFGGTGLGLAISQQLARLLGGDIQITRTGPDGSTFSLRLPVEASKSMRMIRPEGSLLDTPMRTDQSARLPQLNGRILLAEDGVDNQRLLTFILKKAGADVTIVGDGQSAMDAAVQAQEEDRPFDLILMDMQMPVMDGYTATKQLRERGYDGLIVAITAHAMTSDRDRCMAAGCDDYLTKPIDRRNLVETVHRYLERRDIAA